MGIRMRVCYAVIMLGYPALATARADEGKFVWQFATPESQGMSREKLKGLQDSLAARNTKAFLVIRNDRIVYEWYAEGHSRSKPHGTASLAKALVGGVSLGIALTDGRVSLDDRVARFVPQWQDDAYKTKITLRHLGSHTSGLEDAEGDGLPHDKLTGWKGEFWKQLAPPHDPFSTARDFAPVLFEPGERLAYSNPGIGMLTYAVAASLRGTPENNIRVLLRDRILRPLGVPDAEWSVGYGKTFNVDGLPLVAAWGGGSFSANAVASIARLLLHGGNWDGHQLLSKEAVRQITGDAGLPGHCGMGWWTNADGRYAKLPKDAFWGAGAGDQVVLVVPSLKLIVVRNGQLLEPAPSRLDAAGKPRDVFAMYHDRRTQILFEPVIDAIVSGIRNQESGVRSQESASALPYPLSNVITRLDWAPPEMIIRQAEDSDNWPVTWADDNHLYTAYGDGTGFDPKVPHKLSLGFARIEGSPPAIVGVNIRSASGEQPKGNGKSGKKASGLLMVDGVLYMLVRNAGNAQLAWSTDHGRTWTWSDWRFTSSFGYPTFLNFGKNYAGAPDEYVYIFSHDADSAYAPADRMVLSRVPKDRIRERQAYEFFKSLDSQRRPTWTQDIDERGGVFMHPGKCFRCTVSYNAALKRYLLCQAGDDGPVQVGFGVFDAPEPWGPWTTVTYVPKWDVSPGETASFPPMWMSADGKTLHLVFSGGDSFCVRAATLTTAK